MITIQVYCKSHGKPLRGISVSAEFEGFLRGCTKVKFTDGKGECHFDSTPGRGVVYVKGRLAHQGWLSGRTLVYL
jgi:hypothetical protein